MIDLAEMKEIRVDPEARTARAEGGVTWAELNAAAGGARAGGHGRGHLDDRVAGSRSAAGSAG